jgi:hypothetical protein
MSDEPQSYIYHEIPTLDQLLPSTGGIPGVEYAQITTDNLRRAQDEGWSKLTGRQMVYTIEGPNGRVDCELYGRGKPIPGQGTRSGRRRCWVDPEIRRVTGLGLVEIPQPEPEPEAQPQAPTEEEQPLGKLPRRKKGGAG